MTTRGRRRWLPEAPPAVPLAAVSLPGMGLFVWPFVVPGGVPDAPALALSLAAALGLLLVELGARRLDARRLALLAVLAAVDTGLRLAVVTGIGGFSPIFFLVLCSGFVLGPSYGFLVGADSILVSALGEGGVGPWLPYQVFATGWVGAWAGLAGLAWGRAVGMGRPGAGGAGRQVSRGAVLVLAVVGLLSGWAFGALMDVQTWVAGYGGNPTLGWSPGLSPAGALSHFARFYLVTSLVYDSFRAVGNLLMVLLLGPPVLAALSRLRSRLSFEVVKE
ncbi:MAG TPA: ECF transporter S component [Candidatus Dormibacteraeota bacterium]|nr:ECF transporter S component [Candidatus Dormibacteraeota bacterium]